MTAISRPGFYSKTPSHFTAEQRWDYLTGRSDHNAHVRRWYAEQKLRAMDDITTESLLEAMRGPKFAYREAAE